MTDKNKLTADDVRALLSDHVEGALDVDTRAEVDAALAADPLLAKERARLEKTVSALKALERPDAPADIVAKVRDRLAAERRAQQAAPVEELVRPARRFRFVEGAVALAAAAGIAIVVGVATHPGTGSSGSSSPGSLTVGAHTETAGSVAGDEGAVKSALVAPNLARASVDELAAHAGMSVVGDGVYEGDRRAAARFVIALKQAAAEKGGEVSGFVPDAERVRISVRSH